MAEGVSVKIKLAPYGKRMVNVKKGDFIRKVGWYFDVWAEVLSVSGSMPEFKSITIPTPYSACGYSTCYESLSGTHERFYQVVAVCTRTNLKRKKPRIVHLKDGSYGYDMSRPNNAACPRMKAGWPKFLLTSAYRPQK